MRFVVSLLFGRTVSRLRVDVPAFEAEERTIACQPYSCAVSAGGTGLEFLTGEPVMKIEIGHRCGRRDDLHIVNLDAASDNGPNGLSRVESGPEQALKLAQSACRNPAVQEHAGLGCSF
jgi:hypothetical protein